MSKKLKYEKISMEILERWVGSKKIGLDIDELKREHSHEQKISLEQFFIIKIFEKIDFPEGWEVKEGKSYNKPKLNLKELDDDLAEFYDYLQNRQEYFSINDDPGEIENKFKALKGAELKEAERHIDQINNYIKAKLSNDQD